LTPSVGTGAYRLEAAAGQDGARIDALVGADVAPWLRVGVTGWLGMDWEQNRNWGASAVLEGKW